MEVVQSELLTLVSRSHNAVVRGDLADGLTGYTGNRIHNTGGSEALDHHGLHVVDKILVGKSVLLLQGRCGLQHSAANVRKELRITKRVLYDLIALDRLAVVACDCVATVDDVDLSLQIHHQIIYILSALDRLGIGIDQFSSLDGQLKRVTDLNALFAVVHATEYHSVNSCVGIDTDCVDLFSGENTSLDHRLFKDIRAHNRVFTRHDGHFAFALLQSLCKTFGQQRCNLRKIGCHYGGSDDFCVADRVDDLFRLLDIGVCDYVVDDLLFIIVIDQEEGILVLLVNDIYKRIDDICKDDLKSAVVQKLRNKASSNLTCSEMYCFSHSIFSFLSALNKPQGQALFWLL